MMTSRRRRRIRGRRQPEVLLTESPLISARVILEVCPPSLRDKDKAYAFLRHSFACYNSFHAVSVPDLQDESEFMNLPHRP